MRYNYYQKLNYWLFIKTFKFSTVLTAWKYLKKITLKKK